ncbi:MAG TPA: hypothetical protein VG245_11750 [Candidatus Dormibacteraeota bacterium]|jgi:hypothetical protein|nr:hypothetical protein [Candidatus Dormibacteraeota bacterium]
MKVWTLTKGGPTVEVTDTGWISGGDPDLLEEVRTAFEQPLDDEGNFPLPGMRGYQEKRIGQLAGAGWKVVSTHEV